MKETFMSGLMKNANKRKVKKVKIMKVAVTWEVCGYVDIEAETMEEAMEKFNKDSETIPLPADFEYVDGSFQLSSNDVEEMEAMANS